MAIVTRRIPSTDPRLGRHVRHDSRSWDFRFDTRGLVVASVEHERRIPILDQGQLGSCTGNAGIGALGTEPIYSVDIGDGRYSFNENGAVALYADATRLDDYPGQYPPDDTGSDGLSIAKALKAAGEISGYQHTFSLDDALKALQVVPLITGTVWYQSMFEPDAEGIVTVDESSGLAGGHEYVVRGYDAARDLVLFDNSWGTGWGAAGSFRMSSAAWGRLLADQGDVTVFVPLSQPAPVPTPPAGADGALAAALRHRGWVNRRHVGETAHVAHAAQTWLTAHGL